MSDPNKPDNEQHETATGSDTPEQEEKAAETPPQNEGEATSDPWGEALAEQAEADDQAHEVDESSAEPPSAATASDDVFRPLPEAGAEQAGTRDLAMIMDIPVTLSVELGRTKITIKELLELSQGSVIELEGLAGEPLDIQVNGFLIAQGEVVVVDDKYGIRVTEIITPSERVQKLNQ